MDLHFLWYVLAGILIVVGLAGMLLPVLPGLPLMFAGMVLAAWADDFRIIGGLTLLLLGAMTAFALAADLLASMLGARRAGASRLAVIGAGLGLLVGIFFSPFGLLLGPFLGAVLGEFASGKEWRAASKTGFATWLGLAVGAAVKVAVAIAMLGIFALALVL